jgi:hypothetical protein
VATAVRALIPPQLSAHRIPLGRPRDTLAGRVAPVCAHRAPTSSRLPRSNRACSHSRAAV